MEKIMKPLYLILICVSCSWGQTKEPIDSIGHVPFTWNLPSPPITLQDLLDYEKECYADSEYYWGHQRIKNEICILDNNDKCAMTGHWRNIVRHEQPTFKGFIEYLKKRRK